VPFVKSDAKVVLFFYSAKTFSLIFPNFARKMKKIRKIDETNQKTVINFTDLPRTDRCGGRS
jgi:hypothetical protein